jgi:hypothetical protein
MTVVSSTYLILILNKLVEGCDWEWIIICSQRATSFSLYFESLCSTAGC